MDDAGARRAIVDTLRRMAALGLARGTAGNASVRVDGGFCVSPTGIDYATLRPEQVVRLDWDGRFEGEVLPSSEWRFHRDVLRERPEFDAVVHTHSPCATAVAVLGHEIPAIHYMVAAAGGATIPIARYATFGTEALSRAVVEALRERRACLMAHHGVLAAHRTLERALALAVTVEEMAELYLRVLPHPPLRVLDDAEMARVLQKFATYGQQRDAG